MNLRVIYPSRIPYLLVRLKSKVFLKKYKYVSRHAVFSHPAAISTFYIRRNTVDILMCKIDIESIECVRKYINFVFGDKKFGLSIQNNELYTYFESLNYLKI